MGEGENVHHPYLVTPQIGIFGNKTSNLFVRFATLIPVVGNKSVCSLDYCQLAALRLVKLLIKGRGISPK